MQRRHALKLLGGSAVGLGFGRSLPVAAGCDFFPHGESWHFLVVRHDEVIGKHVFNFSRRDGDFIVDVAIDIAVKALGITLFSFTHRAQEVWHKGWLQALVSATDDDGQLWRMRSERKDGALRGEVNDIAFDVSGYLVPTSLWHRDTVMSEGLFDTIDGRVKLINIRKLGEEEVEAGGRRVSARHYSLTGQIERDVWYDSDCAIAKVSFLARDGSLITLERQ